MACDVKPHINFTIGTLMSLREIDLQAETYYDCENGVYDLFTQYDIDFKHYKLSLYRCSYQVCTHGKFAYILRYPQVKFSWRIICQQFHFIDL